MWPEMDGLETIPTWFKWSVYVGLLGHETNLQVVALMLVTASSQRHLTASAAPLGAPGKGKKGESRSPPAAHKSSTTLVTAIAMVRTTCGWSSGGLLSGAFYFQIDWFDHKISIYLYIYNYIYIYIMWEYTSEYLNVCILPGFPLSLSLSLPLWEG